VLIFAVAEGRQAPRSRILRLFVTAILRFQRHVVVVMRPPAVMSMLDADCSGSSCTRWVGWLRNAAGGETAQNVVHRHRELARRSAPCRREWPSVVRNWRVWASVRVVLVSLLSSPGSKARWQARRAGMSDLRQIAERRQ